MLAAACGTLVAVDPPGEPSPQSVLEARGLKPFGHQWCLAADADLKERSAPLERLERHFNELRQSVDQLVEQNEAYGKGLAQTEQNEKRDREQLAAAKPGSPQHKQIDADLKATLDTIGKLRKLYVAPEKLAEASPRPSRPRSA